MRPTPPPPPPPPPPRNPAPLNPTGSQQSNDRAEGTPRPQQDLSQSTTSQYASSYTYPVVQSTEPYGEIHSSTTTSSASGVVSHRTRRENGVIGAGSDSEFTTTATTYGATPNSYKSPPTYAFDASNQQQPLTRESSETLYYVYNSTSSFFLLATLISIFWSHESSAIPQVFLYVTLSLYGLDLINARDALAVAVWIGALVLATTSGFAALLQVDDSEASGGAMIFFLLRLSVEGMLFCTLACWCTLQFRWLYKDAASFALGMEQSLHSLIPPISASILTNHLTSLLADYWGLDRAATLAPILFSMLLAMGMYIFGCCSSSFEKSANKFSIPPFTARIHSMLLLMVPGLMHILTFRKRILSRNAGSDDLYDLLLVWCIPYLLHCVLLAVDSGPYEMPASTLFPKYGYDTLHGTIMPMIVSMLASLALQNRYILPVCQAVSYQFNGHDLPGAWVSSLFLTLATACALFALWTWGRKSTITDEFLFGEYHEDVVQLSLSASGLFLGKSFGIPWSLTPLPILAFLGLSVWITTRMLRYLCLFLFVVHAGGLVLFNYRFAAIDIRIPLSIPGFELGLVRFGMVEVVTSVLVGLVVGFAIRPSGGIGASVLRVFDVPGLLLVLYTFLLSILEFTLLKMPVPQDAEAGDPALDSGIEDSAFLYDHSLCLLTASLLGCVAYFSSRFRLISDKSAIISGCFTAGKAIALVVDSQNAQRRNRTDVQYEMLARRLFANSVYTAILLIFICLPRVALAPVHIKSNARYKRSLANGKPVTSVPPSVDRTILLYCFLLLPGVMVFVAPTVLYPIVEYLSAHFSGGAYYGKSQPFSEMLGFGLTLWGISSLSFLNHYLPDGGAETIKKMSAFTLLMGIFFAWSAPPIPQWMVADDGFGVSNPYASVSSLGSELVKQGRNRTGGWGILSAFLATLLAVTGPLELRERRHHSGRKDSQLLLRLMLFSVLFGSGVSWFITMQLMGDASFITLLFVSLACMVVSFLGTVTCVLGYFLELENFDEVDQMAKVWVGGFLLSFAISVFTSFLFSSKDDGKSLHPFGAGGWLSTYLLVSCLVTLALSSVLQIRSTKNQASRGLGNLSCVLSFVMGILVVYGRFGVSGLDESYDLTTIVGFPASIFCTVLVSTILLGLDTEMSSERRSRVSRLSGGGSKTTQRSLGYALGSLPTCNRLFFPILGVLPVFYASSLYTIFLRGIGKSTSTGPMDAFANVIGKGENSLAAMATRSVSHSASLATAARIAGCGIWTSTNVFGPMIHIFGLAAVVPSIYLFVSYILSGHSAPKSQIMVSLPLNFLPLLLCKGTPGLRAIALIGLFGSAFQVACHQKESRRLQMRI